MGDLFGGKSAAFGRTLATVIAKRYPVHIDQNESKRPSVNRMSRIIEELCEQGKAFVSEHRVGWLGKARMVHGLKWALHEAGYTEKFVTLVTESLTVSITRRGDKKLPK